MQLTINLYKATESFTHFSVDCYRFCSSLPLPFIWISPLSSTLNAGGNSSLVDCDMCTFMASLVDSILEAVLTLSPNRQYLGILSPTMPATTAPEWTPTLILKCCPAKRPRRREVSQTQLRLMLLIPGWGA